MLTLSAALAAMTLGTPAAFAQQASLSLQGGDAALCHVATTTWTLEKTGPASVAGGGTANWTVTATKGATAARSLTVNGFVGVRNSGSAPATIGNIVVNLQRQVLVKGKWTWVSAAADVATAYGGDAATSADIVASASAEDAAKNASAGPGNYVVAGARGRFTETAGSGALTFMDADSNDVWSITPTQTIAPGAIVNLLFTATFAGDVLNIAPGASVRAEVIVTFGNAGARGGSGASAQNIDIDGNGTVNTTSERYVRSVPARLTRGVPALTVVNDRVTLTDPGVGASAGVTVSAFDNGAIGDGLVIDASGTYTVTATLEGAGTATNTAHLDGADLVATVSIGTQVVGYDASGAPIYAQHEFTCAEGAALQASSTVEVVTAGLPPTGWIDGAFVTYSQGGFQGRGVPGQLFDGYFLAVFPGGLEIGDYDTTGGTGIAPNGIRWQPTVAGRSALKSFLGGGGPSGRFTQDLLDASSSSSGGALAKQTAALTLNVGFSGVTGTAMPAGFGDARYCGAGDALDGLTVAQILAKANLALATGTLPAGYGFASLEQVVEALNLAFHEGVVSAFASQYLKPSCP